MFNCKVITSFRHAFRGLRVLYSTQLNFRIHAATTVTVCIAGFIVGLERWEWVAVAICVGAVLAAEAFNTAVELLCDHLHPEIDPGIRNVKDIAAAAVVLVSIAAVITGLIVFLL